MTALSNGAVARRCRALSIAGERATRRGRRAARRHAAPSRKRTTRRAVVRRATRRAGDAAPLAGSAQASARRLRSRPRRGPFRDRQSGWTVLAGRPSQRSTRARGQVVATTDGGSPARRRAAAASGSRSTAASSAAGDAEARARGRVTRADIRRRPDNVHVATARPALARSTRERDASAAVSPPGVVGVREGTPSSARGSSSWRYRTARPASRGGRARDPGRRRRSAALDVAVHSAIAFGAERGRSRPRRRRGRPVEVADVPPDRDRRSARVRRERLSAHGLDLGGPATPARSRRRRCSVTGTGDAVTYASRSLEAERDGGSPPGEGVGKDATAGGRAARTIRPDEPRERGATSSDSDRHGGDRDRGVATGHRRPVGLNRCEHGASARGPVQAAGTAPTGAPLGRDPRRS